MKIFPNKLKSGDQVRIIAPSLSMSTLSQENIDLAIRKLESLGLRVTFGKHVNEDDIFGSSSVQSRIDDLHNAFHKATLNFLEPTPDHPKKHKILHPPPI